MRCGRTSVAGALALIAATIGAVSVPALGVSDAGALVERQRYAMGTVFRIVARAGTAPDATRRAVDAALDEVVRLDRMLSHYDPQSELSRLAQEGARGPLVVSPELYEVVAQALGMSHLSSGRFDMTVGPLVHLWRATSEGRPRPTLDELDRAAGCVGHEKVVLESPDRIRLSSDCMALDLGAIGKGYAVDRAVHVLRTHGVADAVVNGGGSTIKAIGAAPGDDGWPVRLAPQHGTDAVVALRDVAVSTSQRHVEIIEPGARLPTASPLTVMVVAPSATTADALSTALLLSSMAQGQAMLREVADVSVTWTTPDGRQTTHGAGVHTRQGDGGTR